MSYPSFIPIGLLPTPQAGLFSAIPLAGCCWAKSQGAHLECIWPLVPYTTPMYGWCQWVPAADQWKINALKLYSMLFLFIICANLQYPKSFPLELCFYQFCNQPQCYSFNFYMYWLILKIKWRIYMCLWTMSILIQVLACLLFSTKPSSKSTVIFVNWPRVTNLFNLGRNSHVFNQYSVFETIVFEKCARFSRAKRLTHWHLMTFWKLCIETFFTLISTLVR